MLLAFSLVVVCVYALYGCVSMCTSLKKILLKSQCSNLRAYYFNSMGFVFYLVFN
jgi:hypothetical protein